MTRPICTLVTTIAVTLGLIAWGTAATAQDDLGSRRGDTVTLEGMKKEPRVALIIGNAKYKTSPPKSPSNDAKAMAKGLKGLGFDVTVHANLRGKDMKRAIRDFGQLLEKGGGVGLGFGGIGQQMQDQMEVLRGRVGKLQRGFGWDMAQPRVLRLPQPGGAAERAPAPEQGRRLGVTVKQVPDAVREYLELGDHGLMVDGVQDGSLAAACGLRPNDIVLELGGRSVASPADVAAALGAIPKGGEVRVVFLRKGARAVAEAVKQHDAAGGLRERRKPR